ncbi:MAG TPA: ABC transporter substrate-binding protein, partial [Devosiaceae bacterium]|nr:ABC transporter substrate-binding protein [Devosiaceae bacterium]
MRHIKLVLSSALVATVLAVAFVQVQDTRLGILLGFTGPLEALAPPIAAGAQLAFDEVNAQGGLLGGSIIAVTGDSTCADATAAANAADRLINTDGVVGIMGAMCSGATISAANSAGIPAGVVMISPSATSPAVTDVDDNDLLFRTAPSDAYQGQVMANLLKSKGIGDIAIAYVNNDYGKGFADALAAAFTAGGGTVTANEAH